nr:uncharacterized protein LOC109187658 [Ipomoea batatas]GME01642.1 uncharacterized protein LOC109187658 [Ipomoea batatas]
MPDFYSSALSPDFRGASEDELKHGYLHNQLTALVSPVETGGIIILFKKSIIKGIVSHHWILMISYGSLRISSSSIKSQYVFVPRVFVDTAVPEVYSSSDTESRRHSLP